MTTRHDCSDRPSGAILQALGEFNRGDWYDCHETLEDLWIGSEGECRAFYQGTLQIAIALLHWRNGNYGGAVSLLESGCNYLDKSSPICQRIEVATLAAEARIVREALMKLGPEHMAELSTELLPKMKLAPAE